MPVLNASSKVRAVGDELGSRDARPGSAEEHLNGGVMAFLIIIAMTSGLIAILRRVVVLSRMFL